MKIHQAYQEALTIGLGLLLAGLSLEYTQHGMGIPQWGYPHNLLGLIVHVLLSVIAVVFFGRMHLVKWFLAIPTSIVAMLGFLFVCALAGCIKQSPDAEYEIIQQFRLNQVTTSWYFFFMIAWLLTCLLSISIKRIQRGIIKNGGFVTNHLGLYVAVSAGVFGSADIQQLTLYLKENQANNIGYDEKNQVVILPFSVYLEDFILEEFPPKIAVQNTIANQLITQGGSLLTEAKETHTFKVDTITYVIRQYMPFAIYFEGAYRQAYQYGASPAAEVCTADTCFWLTSGSYNFQARTHRIDASRSLVLTLPEPKKYQSNIIVMEEDEKVKASLLLNHTFDYKGWKIYQLGYEEKKGRWAESSTFKLVRDPWLSAVYGGIFMMIVGAIDMIWRGNRKNIKSD